MQNNTLKLTVKQILFFLIFISIYSVHGQKKKDIESIKKRFEEMSDDLKLFYK